MATYGTQTESKATLRPNSGLRVRCAHLTLLRGWDYQTLCRDVCYSGIGEWEAIFTRPDAAGFTATGVRSEVGRDVGSRTDGFDSARDRPRSHPVERSVTKYTTEIKVE